MSDKVIFTYSISASGSQTIQIPYGHVAICTSGDGQCIIYEGNNANGGYFPIPKSTVETLVLRDFCGGTYTVKEVTGSTATLTIWVFRTQGGY